MSLLGSMESTMETRARKLASSWADRYPGLAERIGRGFGLMDRVVPGDISPNVFFVTGETGRYMVRVDRETRTSWCSCPDHRKLRTRCKHIWACALVERARA